MTEKHEDIHNSLLAEKKRRLKTSESLHFGVVCSSNMNRSMEAHLQFQNADLPVYSFGVGNMIRLPNPGGRGAANQSVFSFGTPYERIRHTILKIPNSRTWFEEKGILNMLNRNIKLKDAPERFQDTSTEDVMKLDVVFCFETRVFDILLEDLESRKIENYDPIYIMNLDVRDAADEAEIGAKIVLEVCQELNKVKDNIEEHVFDIIEKFEQKYDRPILSAIGL
eukprot:snap_masked-scaffold_11-processed-gene-5.44-mRNA-1 protein AED:0.04 eAED:0.04 QI:0/0/0/0.5/1/1/2/0/223